MGVISIFIEEVVVSRNFLVVKNVCGEYYFNGYWIIEVVWVLLVVSIILYYEWGVEGDLVFEWFYVWGFILEFLVIEFIS